jgi:prevent-host-death family protein
MPQVKPDDGRANRWPLADAKARFDDLMRRARERGPQRVTVRGRDAVIVLDIGQYEKLVGVPARPSTPDGASLIATMAAAPPFDDVDLERDGERSPVRDIAL